MRVLFILPVLPYKNAPYAGTVCAWHLINYVSKKHDVHLIVIGKDYEARQLEDLKKIATIEGAYLSNTLLINRLKSIVRQILNWKFSIGKNSLVGWRNAIKHAVTNGNYDVAHVDFFQSSRDIPADSKVPIVISCHDLFLKLELRAAHVPESDFGDMSKWPESVKQFHEYKRKEFNKYKRIILYSKFDDELLRSVGNYQTSVVQPAGQVEELLSVNIGYFERQKNSIMFLGALDRPVNQEAILFFAQQVMPVVQRKLPGVAFHIYGANANKKIQNMHNGVSIFYHGFIDDLSQAFSRHQLVVSPLFMGGGLIFKNLQAMASGTPLISTDIGNEGILGVDGKHLLIANNRDEFVSQIIKIFSSQEVWETISIQAKKFIMDNFSWEGNANKFESILKEVADNFKREQD